MEDSQNGRKQRMLRSLLIEPFRQISFGLYVIGICLAFMVVAGALFVNSFIEQYKHVLGLFNVVDPNLRWDFIIDDVFYSNLIRLAVCFSLFLAVMFYTIFKLTHRYYGPLVAINRFVKEIQTGNYSARIILRKGDELQELAKNLNDLATSLENNPPKN